MNQKEFNRLRMLRTTAAQLDELKPVWTGNTMMHTEVAQLRRLIDDIEAAHAKTLSASGKEQREVARDKRDVAITAIMNLVNVTHTWAERMPEEKLLAQRLATRPYILQNLGEAKLLARLEELHNHCVAARPNITDSPLTDEDYRNAQACLNIYLSLQDVARKSDVERQGENVHLDKLFKQALPLLKRIDRLMENYKTAHPVAHAKYRAARSVYDYGTNKRGKNGAAKAKKDAKKEQEDAKPKEQSEAKPKEQPEAKPQPEASKPEEAKSESVATTKPESGKPAEKPQPELLAEASEETVAV